MAHDLYVQSKNMDLSAINTNCLDKVDTNFKYSANDNNCGYYLQIS